MRIRMIGTATLLSALASTAGCATRQEMATWRDHGTHFASAAHALFSLRNDASSRPEVTRTEVGRASAESWWGEPVTVSADQIVER